MTDPGAISLAELIGNGTARAAAFARVPVDRAQWTGLARGCAAGLHDLSALWFESGVVRMALVGQGAGGTAIAALECEDGSYPSVGLLHPSALRLERALRDLHGVDPEGLPDRRPWLDHGAWPSPPQDRRGEAQDARARYPFLPVEGEGLHQIPVGPVHAGIIEPGHFRFTANGETVVRLEERLGYTHKGIGSLMSGATVERAARIAGRISGDSTVAYAFAFARAVEAALGARVPERATLLRGVMAEIERLAHHIGDIGAICNDASAVAIHAHCSLLRESLLRFADRAFGHRLMIDCIVPGGVAADLSDDAARELGRVLDEFGLGLEVVTRAYDSSPSIQDRTVTTGRAARELVRQFAAGGYVGRASGRDFDSRRDLAYPPYDSLGFQVPTRTDGDVNARVWIRVDEARQSLAMIRQLLDRLRPGPPQAAIPNADPGEGAAVTEAFRGDVFVWVRLDGSGRVAHCHARDASWFQWPLLEAAIEGNIVADFPLCNKSFNCSYSGQDV
jgi:Ni,Fe-hydrogenase III large subunit